MSEIIYLLGSKARTSMPIPVSRFWSLLYTWLHLLNISFIPQYHFSGCTPVGKGLGKAVCTGSLVELAMVLARHQQSQHHLGAS